jgi:putative ABC transport system permease protein
MLRAYLRLAVRTLRRRVGYTAVNALGLTVGLACCALVAVFLAYEHSFDTHHADADRIYRLIEVETTSRLSTIPFEQNFRSSAAEQRELATALTETVAGVEQVATFKIFDEPAFLETAAGTSFRTDRYLLTNTGPAFADLFSFDRVAGPPLAEALQQPYAAVLTRSAAARYFGPDTNPVGQTLTLDSLTITVRAVVADPPGNSRIQFDVAVQVNRIPYWAAYQYVRLAPGTDPDAVLPQVADVMTAVDPTRLEDDNFEGTDMQALTDIYFEPPARNDVGPHRDAAYLWVFAAIGLLILTITTINYANLALALYAERNREIGVRKALGGRRGQVAGQFLVESVVLSVLCVPLALLGAAVVLPGFNALMDTALPAASLLQPAILAGLLGVAAVVGGVAGGYPAFVLARTATVDLFNRGVSSGGRRGWSLRHGLIALQFVVLIGLGSLAWVAHDQLQFMQEGDLGYQTDNVVRLDLRGGAIYADSLEYQQVKRRLLDSPAIAAVGTGPEPGSVGRRITFKLVDREAAYDDGKYERADYGWFDALRIEHPVVEQMKQQGLSAPQRVLVDRTTAERFGEETLIGKTLLVNPERPNPVENNRQLPIAGVIENLHLTPMRISIPPTQVRIAPLPSYAVNILVRLTDGQTQAGVQHIRDVWSTFRPETPIRLAFLDTQIADLYEQEARFTTLSGVLAGIAILLAAIGLASLVAYLTRLRMKEIGIRKALGGSVAGIVALLNKEYVQLVGAAFVIGAPLAWWAAAAWLGQFAYQVGLSPLVFVGAGIGALVVAIGAVSTQALRAARVDPATVLRSE